MESLIDSSTLVCRGVSPVASGGPSGSSLTLRLLLSVAGGMDRTVRPQAPRVPTPVRTAGRPPDLRLGGVGGQGPGGDLVESHERDGAGRVAEHLGGIAPQLQGLAGG